MIKRLIGTPNDVFSVPNVTRRSLCVPPNSEYSVNPRIPLWGPSPVLAFLLTFIFTWRLRGRKQRKPRAKITQTRLFRMDFWAFPASRERQFMNARRAGASLVLIFIHQGHVPYFAVFQTSCRSARGTSLHCHSSQQLSPAVPQPRWLALAPEIALCSFSSAPSPLWLPGFGLKGSREKPKSGAWEAAWARGASLKRADIQLGIMQAHTEHSVAFAEGGDRHVTKNSGASFCWSIFFFYPAVIILHFKPHNFPCESLLFNSRIKAGKDF